MKCNNNYDKALKKIQEYELNAPKCCCVNAVVGPTGPTGPTGPEATVSLDSILVDNDGTQTVTAGSLVNLGSEINSTGSALTFTAPNTITVEPGSYYILYESLISNTAAAGDVGASLIINGTVAANASEYVPATSTQTQIALQHNMTVGATTTIQVRNNSNVSNDYHDSSLSVIKIG